MRNLYRFAMTPTIGFYFRISEGAAVHEYDHMVDEFDLVVIDASQSIEDQQVQMREAMAQALAGQGLQAATEGNT